MNEISTQTEPVATTAQRVTFFEDRAEVVRTGKTTVGEGRAWVRLGGMTPMLDDRSVQARCGHANVKVLSARAHRYRRQIKELSLDEEYAMRKVISELNEKLAGLHKRHERVARQSDYVHELLDNWAEVLAKVPLPGEDSGPEEWRKAWQTLAERDDRLLADMLALMDEQDDLQKQINDENARLSTALVTRTLYRCDIEVQLDASSMDEVELEVTYRTPCALWRPEHLARLERNAKDPRAGEIHWTTWGVAWQRTGEEWDDVEVRFSTARPAQVADAPDIRDDVLTLRKKTDEEKKKVHVQVREQAISDTGGARVEQMPGVDDGGRPLEFAPKGKYSLPSNGQPVRVEINTQELPGAVTRVLIPERSQTAYLKADATWQGGAPILAGPLRVARGASLVGRSRSELVQPGESFEVGFGIEDGVRCKRSVKEEREKAKLTGAQTIEREVTLHLSNLGSEARDVLITERIPVSEIEGLEVKPGNHEGWELDKDGYLRRNVKLEPRANLTLKFDYEIRAKSNVVLPF